MTAKRRSRRDDRQFIDPADFPVLRTFCRGYLHQDLLMDHGSAHAAARAFMRDAEPAERRRLAAEWAGLTQASRTVPALAHALRALGASWTPRTRAEARELDEALRPPARP
jgi:hypothetical protein